MMKSLADMLVEYRTRFEEMRQIKGRWSSFVSTAQFLANEVHAITADDPAIVGRLEDVIGAARAFGGKGLTALIMRPEQENDRLFASLVARLGDLRDQLRTARPASEAKLMGQHIDTTQVSDPF